MNNSAGTTLYKLRTENNLSLKQLGEAIGYSSRHLIRIENGEMPMNTKMATKCAAYFNVDISLFIEENPQNIIGRRLQQARIELGMSQKEFANAVERVPQQISKYENGVTRIPLKVTTLFEQRLHISSDYLLHGKLPMFIYTASDYELTIEQLKHMNGEQLRLVLAYIKALNKKKK